MAKAVRAPRKAARAPDWGRMATVAKLRRGELQLSQEELIERMPEHQNIGIETLRRVEAGDQKSYRPTTLAAVSMALDWPPERLWEEAHSTQPGPSVETRFRSLEERLDRVESSLAQLVDAPAD